MKATQRGILASIALVGVALASACSSSGGSPSGGGSSSKATASEIRVGVIGSAYVEGLQSADVMLSFGSFRLIPAQRMLLEDGKSLRLGSRALDILVTLVESAGETIHKDQLIARTWPDTVVDEGSLRVHVAALRKALGDGRAGKRYIANIPGRGYTFVAPVTREQHALERRQAGVVGDQVGAAQGVVHEPAGAGVARGMT